MNMLRFLLNGSNYIFFPISQNIHSCHIMSCCIIVTKHLCSCMISLKWQRKMIKVCVVLQFGRTVLLLCSRSMLLTTD